MKRPNSVSFGIKPGDLGKYVIVPGDPDRTKIIAERMTDAKLIATVRGVNAHTGKIDSITVSTVSTGMGASGASCILEELISLGAEVLIRVGTSGAMQEDMEPGSIVIATGAVRDEGLTKWYAPLQYPAVVDYRIVGALVRAAEKLEVPYHVGIVRTTDGFHQSQRVDELVELYNKLGVLCVEQEAAAVIMVSNARGVYGAAVLAVVGNLVTGWHVSQGDCMEENALAVDRAIDVTVEGIRILEKEKILPKPKMKYFE